MDGWMDGPDRPMPSTDRNPYLQQHIYTPTHTQLPQYETFYLGRSYGRALFIIAAVQSVALLTENVYDE